MNKIKSAVIIVKFIFVFLLLSAIISCKFRQRVPLIIHNAKIYTVDDNFTIAEAMAINDGKIIAIGTNDEILKQFESADQKCRRKNNLPRIYRRSWSFYRFCNRYVEVQSGRDCFIR